MYPDNEPGSPDHPESRINSGSHTGSRPDHAGSLPGDMVAFGLVTPAVSMCTSTRAVIAVCVCARERDARVACHVCRVVRSGSPARESYKASSLCCAGHIL